MSSFTASDATDLFRTEPGRYLDVGGGSVAHRAVGSGPDVLFVHGWPLSGATYRKLLPDLVDHVTCHLIDLPGAGSSRVAPGASPSIGGHVTSLRRVVDLLGLERFVVVGHDSGGLIARHALTGDERLAGMVLIGTEQPQGLGLRFRLFLAGRKLPGFGAALGWLAGRPRLRRNGFVFGDAFVDRSLLDGEFDDLFLRPIATDPAYRAATMEVLRSFEPRFVHELAELHRRTTVPVRLVWGEHDKYFPLGAARQMVGTFPDAELTVVPGAGLLAHEERPAEVAAALRSLVDRAGAAGPAGAGPVSPGASGRAG
jgi:pimeloyl-ACP methyl ester carboxylesterase